MKNTDTHEFLTDLDGGALERKLAVALSRLGAAVIDTGRKGELVLKLSFDQIGNAHMVNIKHRIQFTEPTKRGDVTEKESGVTPMHVGTGGSLSFFAEKQGQLLSRSGAPAASDDERFPKN
jgi:hypothetical protein